MHVELNHIYIYPWLDLFVGKQIEKHRRADQELKKRIVKLEFCLQEARSQTRKLQRVIYHIIIFFFFLLPLCIALNQDCDIYHLCKQMGERRDQALKELRDQLAMKQCSCIDKPNFWESSGLKVIVSMSMLVLVVFSRRWKNLFHFHVSLCINESMVEQVYNF